jgi:hypothetical protein
MRRRAYPYGRYLIPEAKVEDMGPKLRDFVEGLGFPIVKYDEGNEGNGTLIIGVNKSILEFMRQKKPSGFLTVLFSGFSVKSLRDTDIESQRVGVELYLWPISEGILLELFVLPYMEHMNRFEVHHLTESDEEEITDWYLCEHVWEEIEPKITSQFAASQVHRRA